MALPKLTWVAKVESGPDGRQTSKFASTRYRALLPAEAINGRIADAAVVDVESALSGASLERLRQSDAVVLQKLTADPNGYERCAGIYKALLASLPQRCRIVADVNDDHLDDPEFLAFYRGLAGRADTWTVSTVEMGRRIRAMVGVSPLIVPDVVEGSERPARSPVLRLQSWLLAKLARIESGRNADPRTQVLWYGNPMNFSSVAAVIDELAAAAKKRPIELLCLTGLTGNFTSLVAEWNLLHGPSLEVKLAPWEPDAMAKALDACDLVIIPAELHRHGVLTKSPNRLLEALAAGRFAVCHPVPSFLEFQDCCWIGETLDRGIEWALANPDEAVRRVRAGQARLARFHPEAVGALWLDAACGSASMRAAPASVRPGPVRLNVGCGDKHLDGYVNVDSVARPGARAPDVICDIRDLRSFASGTVDEVLAVHVLEHFHPWEAERTLLEWVRVLRPGGSLIIECPDVVYACQQIAARPSIAEQAWKNSSDLMWVLYGDPKWRDALMSHRWGYTVESIAEIMRQLGLERVGQAPAQFKRREPRDFRVVAYKPGSVAGSVAESASEGGGERLHRD